MIIDMLKTYFSRFNFASKNQFLTTAVIRRAASSSDSSEGMEIPKPKRINESLTQRRARLLYQSRKRGMLENDLLLSTFADKYLHSFSPELVDQYDRLINEPSNDWDLYYWLVGKEEPPAELNNEVFDMLRNHTQNKEREVRCRQPPLRF